MSADYSAFLVVGFRVDQASLINVKRVVPRKAHLEPRFDKKTGAPSEPEEVVDNEEYVFFALGKKELDFLEFCEALAKKIKCDVRFDGEDEAVFGPRFKTGRDRSLHPHFDVGGDAKFDAIAGMGPELQRIRTLLEDHRVPTGEPIVGLGSSIG